MTKFQVTLAHKRNSKKLDFDGGVYIQPKLDGVRCYTRLDSDGVVRMYSRNHKQFMNCQHILSEVAPIFDQYPDLVLDGELYNHELKHDFNKIISLVRKSKPSQSDREDAKSLIEYHVYDIHRSSNTGLVYSLRLDLIKRLHRDFRIPSVKHVSTYPVFSDRDIDHLEQQFLDVGYEGAMLRGNVAYENKRSHYLQKVKRFNDSEFKITGFVPGKGKFEGGLGKFLGVDLESGRPVEVPWQKITIAKRRDVWANRDRYINKIATFTWFERTPSGAYRFPQFKGVRDYE